MTATDDLDRDGDARIAAFLDRGATRPSAAALPDLALVRARGRSLRTRRRVGAVAAGTALCLAVSGGIVAERVVLSGPRPDPAHLSPLVIDAPCTAADNAGPTTSQWTTQFMERSDPGDLPKHEAPRPSQVLGQSDIVVASTVTVDQKIAFADGPLPFDSHERIEGDRWVTTPRGLKLTHAVFGANGFTWPDGTPGVFKLDEAVFADARTARDVVPRLVHKAMCSGQFQVVSGTSDHVVIATRPYRGIADLQVIRVVDRTVIGLMASVPTTDASAPQPPRGVLQLVDLAADRAQGRSGGRMTLTYAATPPSGFLQLSDLGETGGWTVGSDLGDQTSDPAGRAVLPECGTAAGTTLVGATAQQMYRGSGAAGGSGELILSEHVTSLDAHEVDVARQALTTARACTGTVNAGQRVLGSSADPLTVVAGATVQGQPSTATTWTLTGHSLIVIDTLPGGAAGGAPQPGGLPWLLATARTAVERATAAGR